MMAWNPECCVAIKRDILEDAFNLVEEGKQHERREEVGNEDGGVVRKEESKLDSTSSSLNIHWGDREDVSA